MSMLSTLKIAIAACSFVAYEIYAGNEGPFGPSGLYAFDLFITTLTICPYCPKYSYFDRIL